MEHESFEPQPATLTPGPWSLPVGASRHDGWTGEKMAIFCEKLADTGIVADACLAAGKSVGGAYALRRRSPLFAAAWEAALVIARERLADTLLERSLEGTVEQYYKDGELIGEKRIIDNRLGLAILRRLDRLAETGSPLHSNLSQFPGAGRGPGQRPSAASAAVDWDLTLDALRTGEEAAIAGALAMLKGHEVEEVEDPLNRPPSRELCAPEDDTLDLSDRCWWDAREERWVTDFPPPAGFDGYESDDYGEADYERDCTPDEVAILEADRAAEAAAERAEEEELRDAWFKMLSEEQESNRHPGLEPGPAFTSAAGEESQDPPPSPATSD